MTHGFQKRQLSNDDWKAIAELLDEGRQASSAVQAFDARLDRFESWLTNAYLPAPSAINWLLDLWEAARSIGADAAVPLERCMAGLAHRDLVSRDELEALVHELRSIERTGSHPLQG
jgi:hypothetical protein